jgi:hypothetical protein
VTRLPEHDRPADDPPDLESMMELVERSAYHDLFGDQRSRRRRFFDALAASDDPMWREIGNELRDGRIALRDVLGVGAYREQVERGFAENQEAFQEALAQAKEQLEREDERRDR